MNRKKSRSRSKTRSRSRFRRAKSARKIKRDKKKQIKKKNAAAARIVESKSCRLQYRLQLRTLAKSNCIYSALVNNKTYRFVKMFKFVNARFKRSSQILSITLMGWNRYPHWTIFPSWSSIKCHSIRKNIKQSPCSIAPLNPKIFYRRATDFRDYIMKLNQKIISRNEHGELFDYVLSLFKRNFVNSNREIGFLHFKLR